MNVPVDLIGAAAQIARDRTHSSASFRALLMGLYDGSRWQLNLALILAPLDDHHRSLAGHLLHEYAEQGETLELRKAVEKLAADTAGLFKIGHMEPTDAAIGVPAFLRRGGPAT